MFRKNKTNEIVNSDPQKVLLVLDLRKFLFRAIQSSNSNAGKAKA